MDLNKNLAVQTYCFRNFKNPEVAQMTRDCDLQSVEIAAFGLHADCGKPETFDEIVKTYKDAGVSFCSAFCGTVANNPDEVRQGMEFAKVAGTSIVTCDFELNCMPECFRIGESLAEEYDVQLAIHNHGGWHWLGNMQMLEWVFNNTSDRIGLCLDTAWAMDARQDPIEMVKKFKDRLFAVHLKDFVFDRAGKPEDVVLGTGNLDPKKLLAALDEVGFDGPAILEYEGDADDPVPATKKCVEAIRSA